MVTLNHLIPSTLEEKRLQDVTELWEESPDDRLDFVHALQYKAKKCNIEEFKKSAEEYDKVSILWEIN